MKHRKGSNTVEIPVWLIVVLFAAILMIVVNTESFAKVKKYIPFFRSCEDVKGRCEAVSNCAHLSDNAYMNSAEDCKDKAKICCIADKASPKYVPQQNDKECEGKKGGESCGTRMVCDKNPVHDNLQCISKCDYCVRYPTDKDICKVSTVYGKKLTQLQDNFKCGCTQKECKDAKDPNTCFTNMCPSDNVNAQEYACCNVNS